MNNNIDYQDRSGRSSLATIITPAYNEALNLQQMYEEISEALRELTDWEWLIVDDHSQDGTYERAIELATRDSKVRCVRLSRNFGSHAAATCGFHHSRGDCAVLLAADLQDPPGVIPSLIQAWREGADVVWAIREAREGVPLVQRIVSRMYHSWMGKMAGLDRIPSQGSDFVLVDRKVLDALKEVSERNTSILGLIAWLGFHHRYIPYTKRERERGKSNWTLGLRIKLAADSLIAFSYMPMRLIIWFGLIVAGLGFAYSVFVFVGGLKGNPVPGWSSTMMAVLVLGGTQMIMIGVIGQYLWRALDEVRRRPLYVVERLSTVDRPEANGNKVNNDRDQ